MSLSKSNFNDANYSVLLQNRNLIINGSSDIWQKGTSVSVLPSTKTYTLDMFATYYGISNCTVSRQTADIDGTQYATKVQRNFGQTSTSPIYHGTAFETIEIAKVRGKKLTFSVYLKKGANFSPTSGNLKMTLYTGTGSEMTRLQTPFTGEVSAGTLTQTLTTSAVKYTFTTTSVIPSATTQMSLDFEFTPVGTAGVDDWFQWEKIQLETNNIVTPFEYRNIQIELNKCYRYYQKSYNLITAPGTNTATGEDLKTTVINTTSCSSAIYYVVPMRINPTVVFYNRDGTIGVWNEFNSLGNIIGTQTMGTISTSAERNFVASVGGILASTSSSIQGHWTASAEL